MKAGIASREGRIACRVPSALMRGGAGGESGRTTDPGRRVEHGIGHHQIPGQHPLAVEDVDIVAVLVGRVEESGVCTPYRDAPSDYPSTSSSTGSNTENASLMV